MKRKIISIFIFLFILFTLASCGENTEVPITPPGDIIDDTGNTNNPDNSGNTGNPDNPGNSGNPDNSGNTGNPDNSGNNSGDSNIGQTGPVVTEVEFVVSLVYNKKIYIPEKDEIITVIWTDEYSQFTEMIGEDGYAKKILDGDFNVYLDFKSTKYTYDANIYFADNENPIVEIELLKIATVTKGKGTKLYSEYELSSEGTYRAEITSRTKKIYYEYKPTKAGYYVIESFVNIYEDMVNPKVDIYTGTFAAKYFSETLDDGGTYKKGGYTKNFKWIVKLSQEQLSNVFTFAVFAQSKTGDYPVHVDFRITYEGEYYLESTLAKLMEAKEIKEKTPNYDPSKYKYYNSDFGTGSYYASYTNGTGYLDASNFKYNEETGYWHLYDKTNNTYGPILCAKITQPCAYYDEALSLIESHGNKNLTVSNLTENYKQFIEVEYAAVCNSDGVCYVTNELKEFLQKFSVAQRLFFDGNGFVESSGVYAIEEDQWLFACGWYQEK